MGAGSARGFTRRSLLQHGAALGSLALLSCGRDATATARSTAGRLPETVLDGRLVLTAAEHPLVLPGHSRPTPAWLYGEQAFPVLRARLGQPLHLMLMNGLKEHSSIHWHGVRVPNAMDGVPYLTQMPVLPEENFSYRFTPPNPGVTIFHPHCNTVEQFGRGLAGVLVVDGDGTAPFDDDVVCVLKDWRVDGEGNFLPLLTAEGAGRAGSFGTLRTTNGAVAPNIAVPPSARIRLRLVNLDPSRIGEIGIEGGTAQVIGIDGNAVAAFPLETWRLGPAMRLDLAIETPRDGGRVRILDYFANEPVLLATLVAEGAPPRAKSTAVLQPATLPEPDLDRAEAHELRLGASAIATAYDSMPPIVLPDGSKIDLLDSLCTTQRSFWAINGKTWPQADHRHAPPPFARFARGTTVVMDLINTTKQPHPMHVHGHSFKVLSASRLPRPVHWADTVLVMPEERVRVAFVADNPGNWMLHCHIIEHQDTGMMAWFEVA
jgi:FtsP/CotA-like multicopper oxidase with cupredoxin domain